MTTHNQDWKDIANAQFSKALALSLTLLIFGIMVTPKVEVRKQVFQTQQMELVDIPMEERERIEAPQTEVDVNVTFQISDVLGTEEVDMAAFQEALSQIGDIYKTTTTSVQQQEDERVVNFVPYDDAPVIIGKIEPVYPEFAKRNKLQGTVVLEVEVLKDGSIRDIRVRRGVGGGLDEAAIEAVRKVRFQPGKSSGQAVDCLVIIPVEFKIQ
ncbi:MAG TPA: energy transducer TonB [Candidatus Cloacimonas sp.]|jgi:protein TonB|nr:energy transducer TonB [Candidatus Cloacimonas sp.]MDD2249882.1 energy transducer TonB [Candidatus Cloacimonadota bacterium]MCK9158434.1 energy transducer TonB [Candidatus Cloacimonas sp.]MDD3734014.1 energy transducer TonB [Candidatus Cloacimonadota bacterium]MDD4676293.1 energy transducer TonB [Candidatus Cloacimonadota bacterium]